jgi:hypothetical protein
MERVSGVDKWQCANPSCEVLGPLIPCVDTEQALVTISEGATYQVQRAPHPVLLSMRDENWRVRDGLPVAKSKSWDQATPIRKRVRRL